MVDSESCFAIIFVSIVCSNGNRFLRNNIAILASLANNYKCDILWSLLVSQTSNNTIRSRKWAILV